jgi:hypothetical protein
MARFLLFGDMNLRPRLARTVPLEDRIDQASRVFVVLVLLATLGAFLR